MKVRVYATAACPWCHVAKEWLMERKIKFEYVDVGADQQAAREMVEKSGQMSVPVIEITGNDGRSEIITGFDEEKLKKALNIR
jgi:glutaredoxin-like YruB-family protein